MVLSEVTKKGLGEEAIVQKNVNYSRKRLMLQICPLKLLKQSHYGETLFVSLEVGERKRKGREAGWILSSNGLRAGKSRYSTNVCGAYTVKLVIYTNQGNVAITSMNGHGHVSVKLYL